MIRRLSLALLATALAACNEPRYGPSASATSAAALPDTLPLPYLPLDAFLRPPPDSGRFNTLGRVEGWVTCPPCPEGALCEPCSPFGVILGAPAPGGRLSVSVEFPSGTREDTAMMRTGSIYAVSVEVESRTSARYADPRFGRDSLHYVRLIGLGFTLTDLADLLPLRHP